MKLPILIVALALTSALQAADLYPDAPLAHDLYRLKQLSTLQAQDPQNPLWQATLLLTQLSTNEKLLTDPAATARYLTSLDAALKSNSLDGTLALDHAKFLLLRLTQSTLTRMEYFANNPKDRAALKPYATLADRLLPLAVEQLEAAMKAAEARQPFDEKAYTRVYAAAADAKYYLAWAQYENAMALVPNDPARKPLLQKAVEGLAELAVDEPDNGVNFQAYLLRGKCHSELGDHARALADFAKAENTRAPNWVQYQARYQAVVTILRSRDYKQAESALEAFQRWIPQENTEARLSAEMLRYRVAAAAAEAHASDREKRLARAESIAILREVVEKDSRFRDLVYEQLAAQVPDRAGGIRAADLAALPPMQQLAVAWVSSQGQKGDTPDSRRQLQLAVDAALAVKKSTGAALSDKIEATLIAGVSSALLGNLPDAARYHVEFAELAPADKRAKPAVEAALQQIGELRRISEAGSGGGLTPDMRDLANRALRLAADTYKDPKWRYPQARMLEESGKVNEAAAIYAALPVDDRNYLDARYRLVSIATANFSRLPPNASADTAKPSADAVFAACTAFVALLDNPPASAPPDVLARAKTYRHDIWIIEAATALHPAVKRPEVALDRLNRLDAVRNQLTEPQKSAVLRYEIAAYQMANQPDKALAVVQQYAKSQGQDAMAVIRGMALSTVEEINQVEPTDPAKARQLAVYVVQLLDPIVQQTTREGKREAAFEYRLIQADMMIRAGQSREAQSLAIALQNEKKEDLRPYLTEARAVFADASATADKALYAKAQDYFTRILARLTPGSEGFWEAWLRILQSMEARAGAPAELKKALSDLKGVYGSKFGGDHFKGDFERLAAKYGS